MARKTNIEVNGKNYFRVTRTIGHRADGTAIRKQFYGTGINEANQKADEYIKNLKIGLFNDNQLHTINTLLPKWLFNVKKNEVITINAKYPTIESSDTVHNNKIYNDSNKQWFYFVDGYNTITVNKACTIQFIYREYRKAGLV